MLAHVEVVPRCSKVSHISTISHRLAPARTYVAQKVRKRGKKQRTKLIHDSEYFREVCTKMLSSSLQTIANMSCASEFTHPGIQNCNSAMKKKQKQLSSNYATIMKHPTIIQLSSNCCDCHVFSCFCSTCFSTEQLGNLRIPPASGNLCGPFDPRRGVPGVPGVPGRETTWGTT